MNSSISDVVTQSVLMSVLFQGISKSFKELHGNSRKFKVLQGNSGSFKQFQVGNVKHFLIVFKNIEDLKELEGHFSFKKFQGVSVNFREFLVFMRI